MELSIAGLSVFVAVPVNRDFPWQTTQSLIETACVLTERKIPHRIQFLTNGSLVDKGRSVLAAMFLKSKANRLFWIDSDMAWTAEQFLRILAMSSQMRVVGAAYPAKKGPLTEFLMSVESRVTANDYGCVPVKGMGLGFTCIDRSTVELLAMQSPIVEDDGVPIPLIFRTGYEDGVYRGEDINFFADCRKAGRTVWADPSIELGHVGSKEYRGRLADALQLKT
jgi:hypothetical protein